VGGIEPRKGSDTLMAAVAELRRSGRRPVLAVVGGHSFQDYREYRERVLASLSGLGLRLDDDVVLLGTVPDADCPAGTPRPTCSPSLHQGGLGPGRAGGDERGAAGGGLRPARLPRVPASGPGRPDGAGGRRGPRWPRRSARSSTTTRWPAGSARPGYQVCARFTWDRCAAEHQRIYADLKWR
jgi:hypothetical protein